MRHGTSNRRSRNNNRPNNRGKGGNNRAQVFDSNGPEVRIRGTAHQILDKYAGLAKDARSSGDMVLAESYLQHAEHYQRIIVSWDEQAAQHDKANAAAPQKENVKPQAGKKDDLGLPNSILGDKVKVEAQAVREMENA